MVFNLFMSNVFYPLRIPYLHSFIFVFPSYIFLNTVGLFLENPFVHNFSLRVHICMYIFLPTAGVFKYRLYHYCEFELLYVSIYMF